LAVLFHRGCAPFFSKSSAIAGNDTVFPSELFIFSLPLARDREIPLTEVSDFEQLGRQR
jgi:hypothetical protein